MHRHAWYNIAMKRIITLLIIAIAIASPLAASSQYATVSVAGGYTSTTRSAIIGAGANYGYLSDVSRFVGIGFGSHLDFAFVNSHYGGFSFGVGGEGKKMTRRTCWRARADGRRAFCSTT